MGNLSRHEEGKEATTCRGGGVDADDSPGRNRSSTNPAGRSVTNSRSRFINRMGTSAEMTANTRMPLVLAKVFLRRRFSCAAFVAASASVLRCCFFLG